MSEENKTPSKWQQREIGALWKNEGRQQKYLSGYVKTPDGDMKVVVFSNKHRTENDRAPHFRIYKSKELAAEQASSQSSSPAEGSASEDDLL